MAYDRGYREHQHGRRRGPELDYGWGVPIRGMYDYSLDYGGLAGPESEDSETIPPYETGPDDWTGPRPRYERDHWAAAEPAGERRYRDGDRIHHARWGDGIVVTSKLTRDDEEVTVAFRDPVVGRKTMLASLANLEIIG